MGAARELADQFLSEWAALDPVGASAAGFTVHEDRLTDYSPEGSEARADLYRRVLRDLDRLPTELDVDERRTAVFLRDRVTAQLGLVEGGEEQCALRIMDSPIGEIRAAFDGMPRATAHDWEMIARRLEAVPEAYRSFLVSLDAGADKGLVAARRQVEACAEQVAVWAGLPPGQRPWFNQLVASAPPEVQRGHLGARLEAAAGEATDVLREVHRALDGYLAQATETDGVGEDRYRRWVRLWLGSDLDLLDTYEWGWHELHRIEDEMRKLAHEVRPGASVEEAMELLDADPAGAVEGEDGLVGWLRDRIDAVVDALDGRWFDIDPELRRIEVRVAPAGSAAAQYYSPPAVDGSRPGTYWYPTLGRTHFPTWSEASTCFHEAVPGHHFQLARQRLRHDRLSVYQQIGWVSGHGEGWAMYAERLMDELGLLDGPGERLGFLQGQLLRAVRVVVDLGVHLGLRIPADETFHPGEVWDAELVESFCVTRSANDAEFMRSEVIRYLGWPAQAISYKVGERVWLAGRDDARRAQGSSFDVRRWHANALDLGPVGLDDLRAELPAC